MKRARAKQGRVVLDKRIKAWNFFFWESGKRRSKKIGTVRQFPTKAAAWQAAKPLRDALENKTISAPSNGTVNTLVEQYRTEKMPRRAMTRQGYNTWLNHYVMPKWGDRSIQELQARPVDLWLQSLELAPKSKVHIRGLVRILWDFAMWRGDIPTQRNPMELVTIAGATKRVRGKRSLTVDEFHRLCRELQEPFHMIALVCICFGLRISEALALKWNDVDWLNRQIQIERGIVHQKIDDVKTAESQRVMDIDPEMLDCLRTWKQLSQFSDSEDWLFASLVKIGRLPVSYSGVWQALRKAADRASIGHISSHVFRHTHRSWLDSLGTPVGIQQALMRHSDVRVTMNTYGTADREAMRKAHSKVVHLALATA
jgi:integrase